MASSAGDVPSAATASAGCDSGSIERTAFERAFGRFGTHRRRRHSAVGDAGAGNAAAGDRNLGGDRKDRNAFGMDAGDLGKPEAVRRRPLECDRGDDAVSALAVAEKLLERLFALPEPAGEA